MVLKDLISRRNSVERVLRLDTKAPQGKASINSISFDSNTPEAITITLNRVGTMVVMESDIESAIPTPNASSVMAIEQKVESKEIRMLVKGPSGLNVDTSAATNADVKDELTQQVIISMGQSIQLADPIIPSEVALELAETTFSRVLTSIARAPDVLYAAAAAKVLKNEQKSSTRLVLDSQQRRTQEVVLQVASNGVAGGVGITLTIRGSVRLLLRESANVGRPLSAGSEPLEEVGLFYCTHNASWPIIDRENTLAFVDTAPTTTHDRFADTPASCTTLVWEPAISIDAGSDHEEDTAIDWVDAVENHQVGHEQGGGRPGPVAHTGVQSSRSSMIELLCWGDNEHGELSAHSPQQPRGKASLTHHSVLSAPGPALWEPLTPWEQVRMVATSPRHTVLVTTVGSVYSCGDGSDGALGHGTTSSSRSLRLVMWFAEGRDEEDEDGGGGGGASRSGDRGSTGATRSEAPEIVAVGAGGDLFGSHSAALDTKGRVYTWGIGSACGRGNRKPAPEPGRVTFDEPSGSDEASAADERALDHESRMMPPEGPHGVRIAAIACGGSYCVALTPSGGLWCWGSWMGGRLGLGPIPSKVESSYMHGNSRKRLLPLLLRPRRLTRGLEGVEVVQVACGDAHTCARSASGALFVWGQNESGQLGLGPSLRSGILESAFRPVPHPYFSGRGGPGGRAAHFVACGAAHTLVIDEAGDTWSWGACGAACLGHPVDNPANTTTTVKTSEVWEAAAAAGLMGDDKTAAAAAAATEAALGGRVGRARHTFRPTSELQAARAVRQRAREATSEVPLWCLPQRVDGLAGAKAEAAAGGERHTVVLLQGGRVAMCGDGVALAHQLLTGSQKPQKSLGGGGGSSEDMSVEQMAQALADTLEHAEPVSTPRVPCDAWFPQLEGRHVGAVACGGQHTIILTRGERLGLTLGATLLRSLKKSTLQGEHAKEKEGDDDDDDGSSDNEEGGVDGPYDCVMLTAGSALPAHRFILARRSATLAELIAQEERPNARSAVLELLLPDLRHDMALALREYLYTDSVPSLSLKGPGSSLPYDLLSAAKRYGLPRLAALCARVLPQTPSLLWSSPAARNSADLAAAAAAGELKPLPPSTLAGDFGGCLGDSTWADVKFVAAGRPIFAHKAVLSAASEYFRVMLQHANPKRSHKRAPRGGDEDDEEQEEEEEEVRRELIEVVVPDSHVCMLRVLIFIYTGHLDGSTGIADDENDDEDDEEEDEDEATSSSSVLLEDLIAADRFQLLDMKRTCESLVDVNASNCVAVLEVSHVVSAPRLFAEALRVTCLSLSDPAVEKAAAALGERHRDLGELLFQRLFQSRAARSRDKHTVNSRTTRRNESLAREEALIQQHGVFPFFPLVACLFFAFLYAYSSRFIVLGPLVPVVNTVGVVSFVAWGAYSSSTRKSTSST